jgi:hypothetical protein
MGVYGGTTVVGGAPTLIFSCSTLSSVFFYLGRERWLKFESPEIAVWRCPLSDSPLNCIPFTVDF